MGKTSRQEGEVGVKGVDEGHTHTTPSPVTPHPDPCLDTLRSVALRGALSADKGGGPPTSGTWLCPPSVGVGPSPGSGLKGGPTPASLSGGGARGAKGTNVKRRAGAPPVTSVSGGLGTVGPATPEEVCEAPARTGDPYETRVRLQVRPWGPTPEVSDGHGRGKGMRKEMAFRPAEVGRGRRSGPLPFPRPSRPPHCRGRAWPRSRRNEVAGHGRPRKQTLLPRPSPEGQRPPTHRRGVVRGWGDEWVLLGEVARDVGRRDRRSGRSVTGSSDMDLNG